MVAVEYKPEQRVKLISFLPRLPRRIHIPTNDEMVEFIRRKTTVKSIESLLAEEMSLIPNIRAETLATEPLCPRSFDILETEIRYLTEKVTANMPPITYELIRADPFNQSESALAYSVLEKQLAWGTKKSLKKKLNEQMQENAKAGWSNGFVASPAKGQPVKVQIGLSNIFSTADTLAHELGHASQHAALRVCVYGDDLCWREGHADIVREMVMKQKTLLTQDQRYLWEARAFGILKLREGLHFARSRRRYREWYEKDRGDCAAVGHAAVAVIAREYGLSFVRDSLKRTITL